MRFAGGLVVMRIVKRWHAFGPRFGMVDEVWACVPPPVCGEAVWR